MTNNVLQKIDECLEQPEKMTPESLQGLVSELLGFFDGLKDKLASPKAEDREKALTEALALKENLESRAVSLMSSIKLDSNTIEALMTSSNFDSDSWNTMLKAKEDLESYHKETETQRRELNPKKEKIKKLKLYKTRA